MPCRLALLQFEQLQSKLGQVHTPMGVVKHACKEMVEPVLKKYLDQDPACKVVLLEPSAGTGMFTGELQQLAKKYPAGRVEVKAYELCPGQAAIANALGHTTTGGWNSLVGKALKRDTFTGGDAKTKLVVVGNPPYGRRGASVVSETTESSLYWHSHTLGGQDKVSMQHQQYACIEHIQHTMPPSCPATVSTAWLWLHALEQQPGAVLIGRHMHNCMRPPDRLSVGGW
jgi:hypothetical protein